MRNAITLTLIMILGLFASLFAGAQTTNADSQINTPFFSGINILSPSNATYNSSLLTLNVSITTLGGSDIRLLMKYSIDGEYRDIIPVITQYPCGSIIIALHNGLVHLPVLNEGSHKITVYAEYTYPNNNKFITPFPGEITQFYAETVYFTINDGDVPSITNLSVENKTYNQTYLLLNFTINQPTSWIGYCLDGKTNVTILGNTTLVGLSNGSHDLAIYANDTEGNMGATKMVTFNVAVLPSPSWMPFQSLPSQELQASTSVHLLSETTASVKVILITGVSVIILISIVLFYQKRSKQHDITSF